MRTPDAVAAQTWRPIETVLVDAGAKGIVLPGHRDLPARTVGGGPLARSPAANAGLEAARGAWIGFLDEDDEIAPTHVGALLAAAHGAQLRVAYSQTRLLDAAGATQRVFGGPFNREALLQSNYIAIHAAIFHRCFVDQGVRFDATLEMFEDWDFWLQLSARADFAFSAQATALYHAAAGESGAGAGANLRREQARAQRDRLMAKWRA